MATKTYQIQFDNDPAAPTTIRGTVTLDGVEYVVTVAPKQKGVIREDSTTLKRDHQSVSQGPGSGACPTCGR